jgi:hypothetical protein
MNSTPFKITTITSRPTEMDQAKDQIDQANQPDNNTPILTIDDKIMMDPMGEFYSIPYESPKSTESESTESESIKPTELTEATEPSAELTEPPTEPTELTKATEAISDQTEDKTETLKKNTGGSLIKKYAFLKDEIEEITVTPSSNNETHDSMMEDVPMESLPVITHSERGFLSVFTDHPHRFKQTYLEHLTDTLKYSGITIYCSIILVIHAFFPFLFEFEASNWIIHLAQLMTSKLKI